MFCVILHHQLCHIHHLCRYTHIQLMLVYMCVMCMFKISCTFLISFKCLIQIFISYKVCRFALFLCIYCVILLNLYLISKTMKSFRLPSILCIIQCVHFIIFYIISSMSICLVFHFVFFHC